MYMYVYTCVYDRRREYIGLYGISAFSQYYPTTTYYITYTPCRQGSTVLVRAIIKHTGTRMQVYTTTITIKPSSGRIKLSTAAIIMHANQSIITPYFVSSYYFNCYVISFRILLLLLCVCSILVLQERCE